MGKWQNCNLCVNTYVSHYIKRLTNNKVMNFWKLKVEQLQDNKKT